MLFGIGFCQSGVWKKPFTLGVESRNYYANDFPGTVFLNPYYSRSWSIEISRPEKTFIHIHFKPKMSYFGPVISFNSMISVNGQLCSFKSNTFGQVTAVHDTMCSFVALPNINYSISLTFNNNPSTVGYWYDDGQPLVSFISI